MPNLIWDKVGDKNYETGLDRGVLYLPDGSVVPWNGLTSIIESFDREIVPVYYDGMKINDLVTLGDFSASMKAVTYPDEFVELEGTGQLRNGLFVADQPPQVFGLCYRTQVGNDVEGDLSGYKIHILYNVTAIPSDKAYASISSSPTLIEFEWSITAIPEEVPGFRPTAHIVISSKDTDPWLLEDLENMLYGSTDVLAVLIPMPELVTYINDWYRVRIIDNGDGTWTAISLRDSLINLTGVDLFEIVHINAIYLDESTFIISDTIDISDVPEIRIDNYPDGTWSATTEQDDLIFVNVDGSFEIRNANVMNIGADSYQISDTIED